jgi:hypothetical protein
MSEDPLVRMGFSRYVYHDKIVGGDLRGYARLNGSFENLELLRSDVAWLVHEGRPYTCWLKQPWRTGDNFQLAQHIGLDFDSESPACAVSALVKDPIIERYATVVYATPSSQPEAPRARVLFCLERPISDRHEYVRAVLALMHLYGTADSQCKDEVRFFYGCGATPEVAFLNRVLPMAKLESMIVEHQAFLLAERQAAYRARQAQPRRQEPVQEDEAALLQRLSDEVRYASQGTRNGTLNRAAFMLRKAGVDGKEIEDTLTAAALAAGLGEREIAVTLRSAFKVVF